MEEIFVDPILYHGIPENVTDRCPVEQKTYRFLSKLGIEYDRVDHEPAMTIDACHKVDDVLGIPMCKNLFLCNRQKTCFYLLMMPGTKAFHTKELSAQIQTARLSFADETYMDKYLGISPGSVSVLGLMNDTEGHVRLLIDEDLLSCAYIGCHPCINTSSLKIQTEDLLRIILPATGHTYTSVKLTEDQ